eukprot:TRINITY_DN2158_c0_g1_i1.p1 TRINITY_DN2158_c0_g1~~TRINITY_DN2158_c0_g1_i1.p1  ORF type:complete len:215 (+),score=45.27 TRINITY_DN2158_c0_g1_i1:719-1363(+)
MSSLSAQYASILSGDVVYETNIRANSFKEVTKNFNAIYNSNISQLFSEENSFTEFQMRVHGLLVDIVNFHNSYISVPEELSYALYVHNLPSYLEEYFGEYKRRIQFREEFDSCISEISNHVDSVINNERKKRHQFNSQVQTRHFSPEDLFSSEEWFAFIPNVNIYKIQDTESKENTKSELSTQNMLLKEEQETMERHLTHLEEEHAKLTEDLFP